MNFFDDLKLVNKVSLKNTFSGLKRNWTIALVGFLYWILIFLAIGVSGLLLRGPFSILRGLFTTLFISSLISNYLVMLQLTVLNRKIGFNDFKEGFKFYVWKIYGIFFILYLVNYLLNILGRSLNTNIGLLSQLFSISLFILFNALPEAIYLKNYEPVDTIKFTLGFMKENWIQWAIPNILIVIVLYFVSKGLTGVLLGGFLNMNITSVLRSLLQALISQVFVAVFMIYRGNLFYILDNSTRRNRSYKYDRD